jgi:5-methylcytosine-specific restriction enzyme A
MRAAFFVSKGCEPYERANLCSLEHRHVTGKRGPRRSLGEGKGSGSAMPTMPPTFRAGAVQGKQARKQAHDQRRREAQPWRAFYKTAQWLAIRQHKLREQPLCERHLKEGEYVPATVVHHVEPHRGDWGKFITGPFESLCEHCHNSDAQSEERHSV